MEKRIQDEVLSEVSLQELFNIEKPLLDNLRLNKGLPYIRLSSKRRVYLAGEVLKWLQEQLKMG